VLLLPVDGVELTGVSDEDCPDEPPLFDSVEPALLSVAFDPALLLALQTSHVDTDALFPDAGGDGVAASPLEGVDDSV
jgi:hypothetical protein